MRSSLGGGTNISMQGKDRQCKATGGLLARRHHMVQGATFSYRPSATIRSPKQKRRGRRCAILTVRLQATDALSHGVECL